MKEGFERVTIDTLGGLCTLMDVSDLPLGLASYASNVEFYPGGFRSRDGFKAYLSDTGGVTGGFRAIYDHVDGRGTRHHITYQGGVGRVGSRTTGTTVNTVVTKIGSPTTTKGAFTTMKAASMYGRVYVCVSDGRRGLAPPFQWDGVTDPAPIAATGAREATITGAGTGVFTAGRYYVIIAFETASGYITGTTKLNYTTITVAPSGITLSEIPLGPPGTVKRRIFLSLVNSFELFNPLGLIIYDNTSTTFPVISLSQAEVAAGIPFTKYIDLQVPTAHLGVVAYANRLVTWGGDGKINPFYGPMTGTITPIYSSLGLLNLDFSSQNAAAYTWGTPGSYGEWDGTTSTASVVAGTAAEGELSNYLRMSPPGGGVAVKISQGYTLNTRPNVDYLGKYYLSPGRKYGLRVRARRNAGTGVGGTMVIGLYETTSLVARTKVAEISLDTGSLDSNWATLETDGTVTVTAQPLVSMDIEVLNGNLGDVIDIAHIEIYDIDAKRGHSRLDISRVNDLESFDTIKGVIDVSPNDGQEVRDAFVLRGNLYIAKENSLYVTQDTGQEPASWTQELVSSTVGTPSVHGVGIGDGWVVIVSRDGLYMFDGGVPEKISQEIQPTWDLFNWNLGEQMYCTVDTAKQTIIVGGPIIGGGWQQLRLSYVSGFGDPVSGGGNGRAWSLDSPKLVHAAPIRLDDGTGTIAYCTGGTITGNAGDTATSPSIVYEDGASTADWNANFTATYRTAPIGGEMERSLFGQIAGKIRGVGTLSAQLIRPSAVAAATWTRTLEAAPNNDVEIRAHQTDTQLSLGVSCVAGTGSYFFVKRLSVWLKKSPSASLRGY